MTTPIDSVGIHPIVILTISDFYNRMRVTSKGKINRVYGALMGQKINNKVEIFSAFEFVNNSNDENKVDLDLKYIDIRRDLATQLFPKFDIVGFFSTNNISEPNELDKNFLNSLNNFSVSNSVYLILNTKDIEKKKEIPVSSFLFDKKLNNFTTLRQIIEGWESERICLETVTKNTDVQDNENGLSKNLQTTKTALVVLQDNLNLIKNNLEKFKNDAKFMELLEDLIISIPEIEHSDYQTLMKNKQKEILLLNNMCVATMENSYSGLSDYKGI